MPDDRATTLRELRGRTSQTEFIRRLVGGGLPQGSLSRERLARVEKGTVTLPQRLWDAIANALVASGFSAASVSPLREPASLIEPVPPAIPATRVAQWTRVAEHTAATTKWSEMIEKVLKWLRPPDDEPYRDLLHRYGGKDRSKSFDEVRARLALGATGRPWRPDNADGVAIDRDASELDVHLRHTSPFVLTLRLHNTGAVAWRDRLLFRIGTPVASSLPLTPALLPVPDTDAGGSCDIRIPGRSQWFPNLAEVSYVMVFADCASCLPGRVVCRVDTRDGDYDKSFELPQGFPVAEAGPAT